MNKKISIAHTLGYPRIGEKRELKKATEAYWQGKITRTELEETGRMLRRLCRHRLSGHKTKVIRRLIG